MTVWNSSTALGAIVIDVDTKTKVPRVLSVDDETQTVEVGTQPLRVSHTGEIVTKALLYRSIYPIYGGEQRPQMFLCFGRLE